jgi:hypothetical protein
MILLILYKQKIIDSRNKMQAIANFSRYMPVIKIYDLNDLYFSPTVVRVIKSRIMRWAGHVARMRDGRGVYRVLVGKPEGKKPLGRPRRRWEDNIKADFQEVGCGGYGLD